MDKIKEKKRKKEGDEPFILSCQASQVFYSKDETRPGWSVVLMAPKKLTKAVDALEDPSLFSSFWCENANLENILKEIDMNCRAGQARNLISKII